MKHEPIIYHLEDYIVPVSDTPRADRMVKLHDALARDERAWRRVVYAHWFAAGFLVCLAGLVLVA